MVRTNKRAELIIEYAVMIGLVAVALAAMQTYMKRGVQGVIKTTADQLGASAEDYLNSNKIVKNTIPWPWPGSTTTLNSQWLGAWQRGLIKDGTSSSSTSSSATNIILTESPPSGSNPVRIKTITKDVSSTSTNSQTITMPLEIN